MLDDHALLNSCDLLLDSWNIGTGPIDKPFIPRVSVLLSLSIFEVPDALNSQSRVMRNRSVRLILLLKNLVNLQRERLRPLLVSSDLKLAEPDLGLPKGSHHNLPLLVPDRGVSDNAVVSGGVVDHLDRPVDHFLVVLEDEQLETCV